MQDTQRQGSRPARRLQRRGCVGDRTWLICNNLSINWASKTSRPWLISAMIHGLLNSFCVYAGRHRLGADMRLSCLAFVTSFPWLSRSTMGTSGECLSAPGRPCCTSAACSSRANGRWSHANALHLCFRISHVSEEAPKASLMITGFQAQHAAAN